MKTMAFDLTREDFEFVDAYCKRNRINEGQGQKNLLYIFIDAYKKEVIANRYSVVLVQKVTEGVMQSLKKTLDEELPELRKLLNEQEKEM